jgi:DNA modification methylase
MSVDIIQADARRIPLADESVQCCVTSPPYWGLRKYAGEQELVWPNAQGDCEHDFKGNGETKRRPDRCSGDADGQHGVFVDSVRRGEQGSKAVRGQTVQHGGTCWHCGAWRGAYGLEPTIEMYVEHTVQILREIRRVLRKDGVCFFNLGDSYASGGNGGHQKGDLFHGHEPREGEIRGYRAPPPGLKPKDLCLIPARVALAAQADGWWVRSMIIWAKPNPMPESVTDRPTDAYEHIIMLTKSERYYWDAEAVKEPQAAGTFKRYGKNPKIPPKRKWSEEAERGGQSNTNMQEHIEARDGAMVAILPGGRNLRNIWTFATQPYAGAHFATFPEELPRRCILAATSERGACAQCGTPWVRAARRSVSFESGSGKSGIAPNGKNGRDYEQAQSGEYDIRMGPVVGSHLIGWKPNCHCRGQHGRTVPCTVLDPFAGSGTTGRVAVELNRRAVLLDLAYHGLARKRTVNVQRKLLEAAAEKR